MPPVPRSVLAFVSTVRVAMVVLRNSRLPGGVSPSALLPSFGFCAAPWVSPSITALATGLALRLVWSVGCEKLIPTGRPAPRDRGDGGDRGAPRRDCDLTRPFVVVGTMAHTDVA